MTLPILYINVAACLLHKSTRIVSLLDHAKINHLKYM
jgi:hypothetical protein